MRPRQQVIATTIVAFALQGYLMVMFAAFTVVALVAVLAGDVAVRVPHVWPALFAVASALCAASIVRPFSKHIAAATGAYLAVIGLARASAVVVAGFETGELTTHWTRFGLWGLCAVIGLRWDRIAFDSGVKHLLDQSRLLPPPPPPAGDGGGDDG